MINQTAQHSAGPLGLPTPGEVHVWTANCDISAERLADIGTTLTADECRWASQFRFEKHRSRYIVRRGVLRTILGAYLNMDPSEIRFVTNAYGKPALQKTIESGPNMHFNLSHSESMIAIGVAVGRRVGIDIELVRPMEDIDSMAERFFTSDERLLVSRSSEPNRKAQIFYILWTRKEAYIKAVGKGLSIPLTSFDTCMTNAMGRSMPSTDDSPDCETWWLSDLNLSHDYVAALVIEGHMPDIKYLYFQP